MCFLLGIFIFRFCSCFPFLVEDGKIRGVFLPGQEDKEGCLFFFSYGYGWNYQWSGWADMLMYVRIYVCVCVYGVSCRRRFEGCSAEKYILYPLNLNKCIAAS